jgi:CxxC motif-containing protein (DUF1111 family)
VLAVPSFGAGDTTPQLLSEAQAAGMSATMTDIGNFLFSVSATPQQGLGPLFNATSCVSCHSTPFAGGMGVTANQSIVAVGKLTADGTKFDPLTGQGGPTARFHSIAEFGYKCELKTGVPPQANVSSRRSAMTLRGNGLLDTIVLGDVLANMATQPAAVRGRPNLLADGRMGKFGWKANVATLVEFMGDAYRNELGLTNPIQPKDEINGCNANKDSPELDGVPLQAVASFLNTLDPPAPTAACLASAGATLFTTVGCASCHSPSLPGRGAKVNLYSDLLLHDMGPGLADRMQQGSATGSEWRTMPLWRAAERQKFLHDGRANTVKDAITAHGGQGAAASAAFQALDAASQQAVLDFVGCI